jgi:prevent-host-death family protein
MKVNIYQAKTHLSHLLQRVAAGEEITIAKAGVPVARLVPIEPKMAKRQPGIDRGRIWISDDFDAPVPAEPCKRRKLGFYGDSIQIADDFDEPLHDDFLAAFLGTEPVRKRARKK